ncbi:MAG: RNA polymerase sigma factor RpoE [Thiotrichales bacterium]
MSTRVLTDEIVTDKELVERVQSGDKTAFNILVQKYQPKIITLVNRYVNDPSASMDVAQEAFVKAYRGLESFRGESAFYTWLYRIAINTAKNYIVAEKRRTPDSEIDCQDAELYSDSHALRDNASPERMLLTDEIRTTVSIAIQKLPEDLKIAITLREIEGMSYEDIATAMECPIGTVRSRIFRAREAIDRVLEPLLN